MRTAVLLCILLAAGAQAQQSVRYEISFANRDHHEARVVAAFSGVVGDTLELIMSRSSPGRYALHEFAKNVYDVHAEDGHGRELNLLHPKPHQWNATGHDGTVLLRYTVFGDRTDGAKLSLTPGNETDRE